MQPALQPNRNASAADSEHPAIAVENLVKAFPGSDGRLFRAVDQLNLTIYPGEILGFLGPNGAGKTTTIKAILGLVLPDQGRISVLGLDAFRQRSQVLRRVGAVLEGNRNIYWDLTVLENLRYWGTLKHVPQADLRPRIAELLAFFDLNEKRHTIGKQLSRGMQQKLAIACALVHDPQILLLDEPTLGLDVAAARMVKDRVVQLARNQGRTVVLTTHQLDLARELCERVAIIDHGRLQALDHTENLIALFSQQDYEFRVTGAVPVATLAPYGTVLVKESNGSSLFRITLRAADGLFGVMTALQQAGVSVQAVNKREADLETVFLRLTAGRGAAMPRGQMEQEPGRPGGEEQGVAAEVMTGG